MYFSGELSIDPAAMTSLGKRPPTRAFGKLFYYLTAGATGERYEVETFTALSILQSLNQAMRSIGLDNIVRLARDGTDFYLDTEGRKGDLRDALHAFETNAASGDQRQFELLQLVLEHEDDALKYVIDLRIRRQHKAGEYPISATVEAALIDVRTPDGSADPVRGALASVFANQAAYDAFVAAKRKQFDDFVERLKWAIASNLTTDDVSTKTSTRLVRPRRRLARIGDIEHDYEDVTVSPLHAGYPGFDDSFFYAWLWADMCHSHAINVHDCTIVDPSGHPMLDVGADGFDASATNTLDPDASFEAPAEGDVTYHDGHGFADEFTAASLTASSVGGDSGSDGGSWLDSFGSSDSGGFSDSGGGSSCGSSCGGCGGGGGD